MKRKKKCVINEHNQCIVVEHKRDMAEANQGHTPTPWILGKKTTYNDDHLTQNIDSGPRDQGGLYLANAYLPEDAAFIVRAVNSHDALLSFVRYYASLSSSERTNEALSFALQITADDLLAKAEKGI